MVLVLRHVFTKAFLAPADLCTLSAAWKLLLPVHYDGHTSHHALYMSNKSQSCRALRQRIVQDTIVGGDRSAAVKEELFLYFGTCTRSLLTMFVPCQDLRGCGCPRAFGRLKVSAFCLWCYLKGIGYSKTLSKTMRQRKDVARCWLG